MAQGNLSALLPLIFFMGNVTLHPVGVLCNRSDNRSHQCDVTTGGGYND